MKKTVIIQSLLAAGLLLSAAPSHADLAYIDFDIASVPQKNANISFDGAVLTGSSIDVKQIVGVGTPSNDGKKFNIGRLYPGYGKHDVLGFSATNYLGDQGGTGWYFGPGGDISIKTYNAKGSSIDLLEGTITSVQIAYVPALGSYKVAVGGFTDVNDSLLAQYYGYDAQQQWAGNFDIAFLMNAPAGSNFLVRSNAIVGGNVINTPVPVPATVLLFGSGIAGLVIRKKCMDN